MPPPPDDRLVPPLTDLVAAAAGAHELYLAYIEAGFTPAQAMQLLCAMVAASVTPNHP